MNIQRLRNLTTGRLHTEMGHIYEDLGIITGETGLMTPTEDDHKAMFERYAAQPNPLAGKEVIAVQV